MATKPGRKPGTPKTGGRKKGTPNKVGADLRAAAREHTAEALSTIIKLMKAARSPAAVKLRAAEFIIERGWGKATQPVEASVVHAFAEVPTQASPDEWKQFLLARGRPN